MSREQHQRGRRVIALVLAAAVAITSCTRGGDDDSSATTTTPSMTPSTGSGGPTIISTDEGTGSGRAAPGPGLRLSDGVAVTDGAPPIRVVDGAVLTEDEVAAVVDRLPEWQVPVADRAEFRFPTETLRPPLVGEAVDVPFPPAPAAAPPVAPTSGPLRVLRYQPEGDVDVAPFVSVTFDRPMVPIGTLDRLDDEDVPLTVTPPIDGRWRWIGTRTLRFEVDPDRTDRLPAATEFRVEVPAGTESADGLALAEAVSWSFRTPAPTVRTMHGVTTAMPLEPVLVVVLDQLVEPADVVRAITVTAGGQEVPFRLATESELDADETAARVAEDALDGRWSAIRPVGGLPVDAPIVVTVGPGVPSAEGPRRSETAETFRGRTFGQLRVTRSECGWGGGCEPGMPLVVEFSNPLDGSTITEDSIRVQPPIPGLRVRQQGSTIELVGATSGSTDYAVTLSGSIGDAYGQTLGDDVERTFRVGPARPVLAGPDQFLVTVDPAADRPSLPIITVNHDRVRLTAWSVDHDDLDEYQRYLERRWSDTRPADPPWPVVVDTEVAIEGDADAPVETAVDLTAAFEASDGPIVVRVQPTEDRYDELVRSDDHWRNQPVITWVQATQLGVDAVVDHHQVLVWTTDLSTGAPRGGVEVTWLGGGRSVLTDDRGLAVLEPGSTSTARSSGVVARLGDDAAFVSVDGRPTTPQDQSRWYVFDDRGLYRPGETVRLAGWVRRLTLSSDAQLAFEDRADEVRYRVLEPQGNELHEGTVALNPLGGFHLEFELPENANLGSAWIELELVGGPADRWTQHTFQIQEYRTPEFEVTARAESPAPYFASRPATVAVDARYYAGGPLPDADVHWSVRTATTTYVPPNWDDFTFGIWQPWWWFGDGWSGPDRAFGGAVDGDVCIDCPPGGDAVYAEHVGRTDASGTHRLRIEVDAPEADLPATVTAEAGVTDVNRQTWAARTDLLVHAAQRYVGLRSDRTFVEQGSPIRVDAVVTDVDGEVLPGVDVSLTAGRVEWTWDERGDREELLDVTTCRVTSTDAPRDRPARCEFATEVGGQYRVTAVVTDGEGRRNRTELTIWVSGAEHRPARRVQQEQVTIVPDRETYRPGDVAELLVQAPFAPASALVTVVRNGIVRSEVVDAPDGSAVVSVPIEEAHVPNLAVQVEMVGAAPRTGDDGIALPDAPNRPAFASGVVELAIPPVTRSLEVAAVPADPMLTPGSDTSVTLTVTDAAGTAVAGAQVALVVVDEAVLALTGYQLVDPLEVFYAGVPTWITTVNGRSTVLLDRPDLLGGDAPSAGEDSASDGDDSGGGAAPAPDGGRLGAIGDESGGVAIQVRADLDALAVFAPEETTAADGTVTVAVPLPDNVTRYRVMAVAVDGADRFGRGESSITARLPLTVRPSAPRVANLGDRFELPVVVQNQTDEAAEVDVVVEVSNLELTGPSGRRITVPAQDRVEVRFPVATDQVGTARVRAAAVRGDDDTVADAVEVAIPVLTPATAEAFATYGTVDDDVPVVQPVAAPGGVLPGFGGLEIGTSSTALQALTDAVLALHEDPYDWADGYASRILAVVALRDVLEAFRADGLPPAAELNARVADDVDRLVALRNDDGGFPTWQRGRPSVPWTSIQATQALVLADQAGYPVPADALGAALAFLAEIERHIPSDHGPELRDTLLAYALHVRSLAGDRDVTAAKRLLERAGDRLEVDALAWLWPLVDDTAASGIARTIANRAVETAGAATFATSYGEDAYLVAHSDRRTDGIVLDALLRQDPDSDLIPKVVVGLLGNQVRGRWSNVQEHAFILLALHRYFTVAESITPEFVARVWLGAGDDATYVAEHEHVGRTTDRTSTMVPMDVLQDLIPAGGDTDLVVAKDGPGRLYYRIGLRYAPADLVLDPRDEGFVVDRVYEAVDDPADVTRNADGTWAVRAGATVRVRLTMVADARRTHVALVDPLPAGFEPLNPALAVTPAPRPQESSDRPSDEPSARGASWCWCWNWFEHQNLRDDRAEAFTSFLPAGTYEYTYLVRATTPGVFVAPPTRAEEVYAPEVFGRAASTVVTVR